MNKKYVKTEVLSITRTEEVSLIDVQPSEGMATKGQLALELWEIIKKLIFWYKPAKGKDNGSSNNGFF